MTQPRIPGVTVPALLDEKEHMRQTIEAAHMAGFLVAHFRSVLTKRGWQTPVQADGAGFPDLCLVGRGKIMFRECKTDRSSSKVRPEQQVWLDAIELNGGDSGVWRPRDMRDVILPELGLRAL